jgi:HPr kinase/phosphorylase
MPAVLEHKKVELILHFMLYDEWLERGDTDRLALSKNTKEILGVAVAELHCPVSPGRNMAEVVEIAAMNHMLRMRGYESTESFSADLVKRMGDTRENI